MAQESTRSNASFSHALAGGALSGLAVDLLFFPIDTVKTRLQSQQGFIAAGGFKGIYRGAGSVLLGSAPGAASFFVAYETANKHLPSLLPYFANPNHAPQLYMLAASIGEITACLIRVPTEVIKSRQQTMAYGSISSIRAAQLLWQSQGLNGFYRGFTSTIAREIPFTCIQFPIYESLKEVLAAQKATTSAALPLTHSALCGSLAGAIAAAITTPLDVCKTRIMLSNKDKNPSRLSDNILPTMQRIYRNEGMGALFRGVVPRTVWISLGGAVFLGTYEAVKKFLGARAA